jgi:hypothetical protein
MATPVWRILVLMSMIGLTVTYQGTSKLDQTTYAVSYRLNNGYLTTVHVTGGHMDIIDPKGNRVGYGDIMEGLEIPSGGQATVRIRVVLTEPLKALVGKYPTNARVTFRGYVTYDTGWLSWLFGSGKLEFEENAPLSMILEYLGAYGIND